MNLDVIKLDQNWKLKFDDKVLDCFLENQLQLLPETVAETREEAADFLTMCFAVVVNSKKEVWDFFDEEGLDLGEYTKKTIVDADEVFDMATRNGAEAFGIDAGVIAEGKLADALLINLNDERMTPCYNLISNWVYSADTSCIDTVICDGRILMQNRELKF